MDGPTTRVWVTVITRCLLLESRLVSRPPCRLSPGKTEYMQLKCLPNSPGVRNVFTRRPLVTARSGKMPLARGMKLMLWEMSPLVCRPATLLFPSRSPLERTRIRLNNDPSRADPFVLPGLTTLMTLFLRRARDVLPRTPMLGTHLVIKLIVLSNGLFLGLFTRTRVWASGLLVMSVTLSTLGSS